jgi:prepilin-type N-terminal cleavage/methylation domain-containing protein
MKKAFTLLELVVSIALLAIIFLFATMIFKVSINSYRTSIANAEIMQKLRAITDQLNADFEGICMDAPLLIWFENNYPTDSNRYDQIMFFADGDFQSTQLYNTVTGEPDIDGDKLVIGNTARIFYGQAQSKTIQNPSNLKDEDRLLARRQHILTADVDFIDWPRADMSDFDNGTGADKLNERYEHDRLSLAQWKTIQGIDYDSQIIPAYFVFRPLVDKVDPNTFHKLICEGVGSFAIQWAYWDSFDNRFYWFPSRDPDGNGQLSDSHFFLNGDKFGVFFNIPGLISFTDWNPVENLDYKSGAKFPSGFYPEAIKFTFRLYDSKGFIKQGRTFTHIVYLGD